eukprot:m.181584 g.181584  ORF g.181584 m.181584 type:complete len:497 (+) comp32071_c0_seq1:253-1743(+)
MVDNYTASALVRDLHKTPRFDWTFRSVTFAEPFTPDNDEYQKCLSMITFAISVFGFILVVFGSVLICPNRKSKQDGTRNITNYQRAITFLLVVSILVFLQLTAGINLISNSIDNMETKIDAASHRYQDIESRTNEIRLQMNHSLAMAKEIEITAGNATLKENFIFVLDECLTNITTFQTDHASANYNATALDRVVGDWKTYMVYGSIGLTVLLVIPIVIGFGGICAHSSGLLKTAGRSMMVFLLLTIIVGAAEFTGSVAIADFCMAPNNATVRYMTQYVGHDKTVLSYYVNCPPGEVSPLQQYFDASERAFSMANSSWTDLINCDCVTDPGNEMGAIYLAIGESRENLAQIEGESTCSLFHTEFVDSVKEGCGRGLTSIVLLFTGHFICGLLFLVIAAISAVLWPEYATGASSYRGINEAPTDEWAAQKDSITAQQWYDGQGQQIIDTEWANRTEENQRQTRYRELFAGELEKQARPGSAPSTRMHDGQVGVMTDI